MLWKEISVKRALTYLKDARCLQAVKYSQLVTVFS